jgi:ATP-dependent Clp protease ATP-binding subunit ClpA
MFELDQGLEKKLRQLRVRVDATDADTLFLRNVPANKCCFNKVRTNLLIKRPRAGQPFIVCVDEDLEYTGTDTALLRAFSGGHRQQGWRVIYLEQGGAGHSPALIENALRVLGSDGSEPVIDRSPDASQRAGDADAPLLAGFGTDISEEVKVGEAEPTVGRDEKIEEVLATLAQWRARLPVILGRSGVGKTNLLYGVARRLKEREVSARLLSVDLGVLMAGTLFDSERESLLAALLKEAAASPGVVLALEHLELALLGVPRGQWLLAQALEQGLKMIGTSLDASCLELTPLARRIQVVELSEPWPDEMGSMLGALRERISRHHRVGIDEEIIQAVIENDRLVTGWPSSPARAINLLDAAAARAALAGKSEVSLADVYLGCSLVTQSACPEEPRSG